MKVRYLQEWNTPKAWVRKGAVVEMTAEQAKPLINGDIVEAVIEKPAPKATKK
jgi:hypothetical protein